jgi:hypothetical protein
VWGVVKCYDRTTSRKQKIRLGELTWFSLLFDESRAITWIMRYCKQRRSGRYDNRAYYRSAIAAAVSFFHDVAQTSLHCPGYF